MNGYSHLSILFDKQIIYKTTSTTNRQYLCTGTIFFSFIVYFNKDSEKPRCLGAHCASALFYLGSVETSLHCGCMNVKAKDAKP